MTKTVLFRVDSISFFETYTEHKPQYYVDSTKLHKQHSKFATNQSEGYDKFGNHFFKYEYEKAIITITQVPAFKINDIYIPVLDVNLE